MPSRRRNRYDPKTLLLLVIGAGFILLSLAAFLMLPDAVESIEQQQYAVIPAEVNYPAPEVRLSDLEGRTVSLSDYRGQVVLYNAWATWCPPCREEMPTLQAYYEAYQHEGFVVIAIEDGQPVDEVAAFVQDYGLTFPVWPDARFVATTAFRTKNLPSSFVIDREGIVRLTWIGAITRDALEEYVTPLIRENQ